MGRKPGSEQTRHSGRQRAHLLLERFVHLAGGFVDRRQNEIFETTPPEDILRWITDSFAPDAVLTMIVASIAYLSAVVSTTAGSPQEGK